MPPVSAGAEVKIAIAEVEAAAASRPAGYVTAVMAAGRLDGEWVWLTVPALEELMGRYGGGYGVQPMGGCKGCGG